MQLIRIRQLNYYLLLSHKVAYLFSQKSKFKCPFDLTSMLFTKYLLKLTRICSAMTSFNANGGFPGGLSR